MNYKKNFNWLAISSLGFVIVVSTVIGFVIGYYLDKWLQTDPYLTLTMLVLGMFTGIWTIFKDVKRLIKND